MAALPQQTKSIPRLNCFVNLEGRPVSIVTATHFYGGHLETRDRRVSEVLNDMDAGFLKLSDVLVFRMNEQQRVGAVRELVIPKEHVQAVLILDDHHESQRYYRVVNKPSVEAFVATTSCDVRGHLQLNRVPEAPLNAVTLLLHLTPQFFPLTEAHVRLTGPTEAERVPVAFVNTHRVEAISLGLSCQAPKKTSLRRPDVPAPLESSDPDPVMVSV